MADNELDNDDIPNEDPKDPPKDDLDLEKRIQEEVDKKLAKIKENLDKAYEARDKANATVEEFKKKEREAELKRLEEEGKHKERYEILLKEQNEKNELLEKKLTEITRDSLLKEALRSFDFRNERALELAFRELLPYLIKNENGEWVHKSGVSIKDAVKQFSEDEDQSFLFKPKTNSGGGSSTSSRGNTSATGGKRSLFEMSQQEVLKLAEEGKL